MRRRSVRHVLSSGALAAAIVAAVPAATVAAPVSREAPPATVALAEEAAGREPYSSAITAFSGGTSR
jgi:hypothetical protein